MKRVLLTGASGFVGRHCLQPLMATGYEVHAVASPRSELPRPEDQVHWHRINLLDNQQTSDLLSTLRPSHLLHCAWYAVPGRYWTAKENFDWVTASLYLFEGFTKNGGERVVAVGSCAEYDWRQGRCAEWSTPLNPATTYGQCKHALQLLLAAFSKQMGLSSAWARLFFLYGPHEPAERLVASVVRSILANEPARCSDGQQVRDFLYVKDAAEALVALLNSDVSGPVNIASGIPVKVLDVIQEIANQMERPDLLQMGALTHSQNDPPLLLADVGRLREEIGWRPQYDLQAGVSETIEWWRRRQEGASR